MTATDHIARVELARELHSLREELLGIANTAASLVDRADQLLQETAPDPGSFDRLLEQFLAEYHAAYARNSRGCSPDEANQEALHIALAAILFPDPDHPQEPASSTDAARLTVQQRRQLLSMREAGWEVRLLSRNEFTGTIVVEGSEPNGDPYTGQINTAGIFRGEPNDVARLGQWVGIGAPATDGEAC